MAATVKAAREATTDQQRWLPVRSTGKDYSEVSLARHRIGDALLRTTTYATVARAFEFSRRNENRRDHRRSGPPNEPCAANVKGHSLILRTSPGRRPSNLRLSVSRSLESLATWFAGITSAIAATALSRATAATQSDLLPSGAVTSTMGVRSVGRARSPFRSRGWFVSFAILDVCRQRIKSLRSSTAQDNFLRDTQR
jgi:hypothetical protein